MVESLLSVRCSVMCKWWNIKNEGGSHNHNSCRACVDGKDNEKFLLSLLLSNHM